MTKLNQSQNLFLLFAGICLTFLIMVTQAEAAETWFPEPVNTPAYVYNPEDPDLNRTGPIFAIPASDAGNYELNLVSDINAADFKIDDGASSNLFEDLINSSNAIFGYAWSKRVGWINFSHGMPGFIPEFGKSSDNKDILKGFIWSKNSGWIQLSSEGFNTSLAQSTTNWGVVLNGSTFGGRAWGPGLGWIDFSHVTFDSTTGKFGGYACSNTCTNDDKIYFAYSSNAPGNVQEASGDLTTWGVSKNMARVIDAYSEAAISCNLISEDCLGNNYPNRTNFILDSTGNKINLKFPYRLEQAGDHILTEIMVTNIYGQTISGPAKKIKSVVWPTNCTVVAGKLECDAPNINIPSPSNVPVADGVDKIDWTITLTNSEGETITTSLNMKSIILTLSFEDNVRTNQLNPAMDYNAVKYNDGNGISDLASPVDLININEFGEFNLDLTSLAPTSSIDYLKLTGFEIQMTLDDDAPADSKTFTFASGDDYSSVNPENYNFQFKPALTTSFEGFESLIENAPSEFNLILTNNSTTETISKIDLNSIFDGISAYLEAEMKAKGTTWSDVTIDQLELIYNAATNYLINGDLVINGTTFLTDMLAGSNQIINFSLTPKLFLGDVINLDETIDLNTEVAYKLPSGNDYTYHKTATLDLASGAVKGEVEIIGISSGDHIYSIYDDTNFNNIAGISFGEMSEVIRRNVAEITRNETAGTLNATITDWSGNLIDNNKVLYYKGDGDLIIGNGSDFVIPDTAGSIIVIGGDVYIKNNLVYNSEKGSLGIIVIKDVDGNGGNVYIDPAVTNLVGGIYAEGSLISAEDDANNAIQNTEIYDGFNGNKMDLVNQLFLKGTLITHNTIGGSRQDPVTFPEMVDENCGELGSGQPCAERYDLNYMRIFSTSGATVLNGGMASIGTTSTAPFVIEYDPRIQSNVPPAFEMDQAIDFKEILQ